MVAKTERFEMRVDEETLNRVDRWRAEQDDLPSRAEAMRRLVEIGLSRSTRFAVKFSDGEKLLATMMRDIYKALEIDGDIPDFICGVIDEGHYWAPKWMLPGIFNDEEDSPEDVDFVGDVLEMWSFLERGYAKLTKKDRERVERDGDPFGKSVRFWGFDGNNEASLGSIAQFLVEQMNRYAEFKGRDLNSRMPTIATYKRMLAVFAPMRMTLVGRELNASEIIRILTAMKYPE
ncbi:MAG TPA: YfbU family protein [Thermoanaerobaculia bacterium]|jgi:uncharacterized protein YfbU (UPF0304 family)|nr:YfbU family protein [Thermoanaerobaculia bacterium]